MRLSKLILILSLLFCGMVSAQVGTEFWFAPPDVSYEHYADSKPLNLHITALYNTHVEITRPADVGNPGFIIEFDLVAGQTQEVRLDADPRLDIDEIEVYSRATSNIDFKQGKGFLIKSYPGEITAYYELAGNNNTDIIALKSNNALGSDFWVSTQRKYKNHGYTDDFSGFVVVATEDGTTVNIDPNGNNLQFHGSTPFSVTNLKAGEAFAVRAAGQAPAQHLFGVHVTTNNNKKVTIIIFDDSMQIDDGSGNWDIFADQLVPVELIGKEYIVLKGEVQDQPANTKDGEAIFITSTKPNTIIYIDGVAVDTMLQPGDYFSYDIKNLSTHVRSSEPVYVNHITGYSTNAAGARELGGAILPSIDKCTGSYNVSVKRTPASGFVFFNNLMVRNDTLAGSPTRNQAINSFTYSINGGPDIQINPSHFTYIMDSAFAIYDRFKAGGAAYYNNVVDGDILTVKNSVARFHLGVMQGKQSPGCKYGYFSDYAASIAAAGIGGSTFTSDIFCNLNPIKLVATGGTSYEWYAPYRPGLINNLDYDSVPEPFFFPDSADVYYFNVIVQGECQEKDTLETEVIVGVEAATSFNFSSDEGCSPFAPILTNFSDTIVGVNQIWTIETATGSSYQIDQDTIPMSFELPLPENNTDSIQTHTVSLIVKGPANSCPTRRSKDIKVKPAVVAGLDLDVDIGCHPLTVAFENHSMGDLDTNSYTWDFGDNSQSFDFEPGHVYTNYGVVDSLYIVELLAESPHGCRDSVSDTITVHPRVRAAIAMNTSASCSPLDITIDPTNSIGVDTFFWHIQMPPAIDSIYKTTVKAPVNLYHRDTTYASPDTIIINMQAMNRMGCTHSVAPRSVVVYPEVTAQFDVNKDIICDADSIEFTNNSLGFNLFYDWDFDDGTVYQDITGNDTTHTFFNRSPVDSSYIVSLEATSGFNCVDVFTDTILVHPYVKANFGMDYDNNCTPLLATFSNLSIQGDTYEWIYGNGTNDNNPAPTFTRVYSNPNDLNDTTYFVRLVTHNNEGCSDTLTRPLDVYPDVVADFTMDPGPTACSPRIVSGFSNNSTGGLLSYLWDFGNSTTSTNPNPISRNYTNYTENDTTYYIQLTAFNPFGCADSIVDSVDVYAFVDADFNLPQADSCSPFVLQPENLSSAGAHFYNWELLNTDMSVAAGPITTFTPNFGALQNLTTTTDTFYLRLLAYGANDPDHLVCADRDSVRIKIYPELNVDFSVDAAKEQCQPLLAPLSNHTNILNAAGTNFVWSIGNTFYSAQETPASLNIPNLEDTDQQHVIRLAGTSKFGCTDSHTDTIIAYSLVDAQFTINKSGICSGNEFELDRRTSRGGIVDYNWTLGGTTDHRTDEVFSYSFENLTSAKLTNQVKLVVSNSHACTDTAEGIIDVYPQVRASIDLDSAQVCYPFTTSFVNTTENASVYAWDFGDGTGSNKHTPDPHSFSNFGNTANEQYTINLIARSQYNCYDTAQHDLLVYAQPDAEFYFPTAVDCPPFNAEMKNQSVGETLSYLWDFGDGSISTTRDASHLFTNNGSIIDSIPIGLRVTSAYGCIDSTKHILKVYPDVEVDFTASTFSGCSPLSVSLNGTSTNSSNVIWHIDDQAVANTAQTSQRLVNKLPDTQVFNVQFSAHSVHGCADDTTKQFTVYSSPTVEFIPDPRSQEYNTQEDRTRVNFANETFFRDNWSYAWDFGDGNSGDNGAVNFDYYYGDQFWGPIDDENRIPVSLTAWNTENETCRDSVTYDIQIRPPLPQIALEEDISGCVPFTVDFSSTTKYVYEDLYEWEFGFEGETSSEAEPSYTFEEDGVYTVKLVVRGDGGTNWDTRRIYVHPKPEIDFTFNDSIVFVRSMNHPDELISFYNHTESGENYYWGFNLPEANYNLIPEYMDTATVAYSTSRNTTWFYDKPGTYHVFLYAQSAEGCEDTLISSIPITVKGEGQIKFPTGFFVDPSAPRDEYISDPENPSRNIFRAYGQGVVEFHLMIYNRWGVLVYETDDINKGWNGFIDGEPAKQDVYVWRAKGQYTNGEPFEASGDVTLIISTDPGQVH